MHKTNEYIIEEKCIHQYYLIADYNIIILFLKHLLIDFDNFITTIIHIHFKTKENKLLKYSTRNRLML